ncbi:unnamed protein product [Ilex paraguariensis]|uniref:DM8 domain-containing protein n=1 Tax=Ilex paraguariensis TaxID=185542 RepID=A0ABC8RP54_9AQUA
MATAADVLETPTLDSARPNLLQRITEQGGYSYVRMASVAVSNNDFRAAEAASEMAWEQLHSGPWHSVLPIWRDAYSMACLQVAKFYYFNGDFGEALRVLDMGLIMGGVTLRKDLDSAVEKASKKAGELMSLEVGIDSAERVESRIVCEEFDEAEVLRVLPIKSLSCKIVGKRSALSLEGFLCDYVLSGLPVIISDCMAHWPASTRWNNMDYLMKVAGYRTVPVEVI